MPEVKSPIEVFFSYAHEDEALRDELAKHLRLLERQKVIKGWYDRGIVPGQEWDAEIKARLESAGIILLLVSADFLASDYSWGVEVERALARHAAGAARVIPVILRPCDWKSAPFGKLQALPKDAKPITRWADRDEAFLNVAEGIRAVVGVLLAKAGSISISSSPPKPALTPSDPPNAFPTADDPVRIYELLNDRFSQDELADLCMRLGLDWDNLAGGTRSGKARELVGYLRRRNRIPDLVQAIRRVRPDVAI